MSYEKIFEYDLDITGVTDHGSNMEALFTGQESTAAAAYSWVNAKAAWVRGMRT